MFNKFLKNTCGTDLWQQCPDRNRFIDWTSRGWRSTGGGNIINRVVVSGRCLLDSEISTDRTWVPGSDHRAVKAKVVLKSLNPDLRTTSSTPFIPSRPLPPPRIKYPSKDDKYKFALFADSVDRLVALNSVSLLSEITSDESYIGRYNLLTTLIEQAAVNTFGRNKPYLFVERQVTSPRIRELVALIRHLGGAILRSKGSSRQISYGSLMIFDQYSAPFAFLDESLFKSVTDYMVNARRTCHKELYAAKKAEILERARRYDAGRIKGVLFGSSSKKLMSGSAAFVPLPTVANSTLSPGTIVTDPASVAEETRQYFTGLYRHSAPPDKPKPWLTTPSVSAIKSRVLDDPFLWPIAATLSDFRALLPKGNPRPSPGPDRWEKWCVKNLSDKVLQLVLDLHNYSVINARFPGDIKDTHLTYFHKRGIRTDLSNWRGLLISNFLANSPMTWLNFKLSPYAAQMGIIPETQVATQPGVQTRDLMSFLSGLKTWSHRTKTPLYLLKRDQMKGFDYLAPQGFYDACTAYGLPPAVADLDHRAAQSSTRCFPRTAFGIADPIVVEGVTKQRGPMSPFKAIPSPLALDIAIWMT
jgi:hypothetical protein